MILFFIPKILKHYYQIDKKDLVTAIQIFMEQFFVFVLMDFSFQDHVFLADVTFYFFDWYARKSVPVSKRMLLFLQNCSETIYFF